MLQSHQLFSKFKVSYKELCRRPQCHYSVQFKVCSHLHGAVGLTDTFSAPSSGLCLLAMLRYLLRQSVAKPHTKDPGSRKHLPQSLVSTQPCQQPGKRGFCISNQTMGSINLVSSNEGAPTKKGLKNRQHSLPDPKEMLGENSTGLLPLVSTRGGY